MRKITKRSAAIIAASAIAVGGGAAAWAAWSVSGTGNTATTAGSVQALDVSSTVVTQLVPGQKSDLTINVVNYNRFPVLINSISLGSITSNKAGCAGTNIVDTGAALPGGAGALLVPAATSTANGNKSITVVEKVQMIADAANECQGAEFSFATTLGANSAA